MKESTDHQPSYDALLHENNRLKKINAALIERVEAGAAFNTAPYAAFEHAATLADQVRERTEALSVAMSELRETNHALTQANLSRTKFLAALSHDLLQPLNAARLFTGALLDHNLDGELKHLGNSIHRSLQDVDSLLGTLVDISRLDAGVIKPDVSCFPISDLLDNLAAEFQQLGEMDQRQVRYYPSSCVVTTDLVLLARILRNFLTNAMRYTPPHSRIVLGCRRRKKAVEIQVLDQGVGIADDQLELIFEEFRRVHTGADPQDRGLGLGLAIVEKIAGMLDHSIKVQSIKGCGSMFSVTVPCVEPSTEGVRQGLVKPMDHQALDLSRIWVLDNDPDICTAMVSLLTGWGCQVEAFQHTQALEQSLLQTTDHPDVIIADYHLDEAESGLDGVQRLQQDYALKSEVLLITANHTSVLRQQARLLGFKVLNKPVKPLKLKVTLAHLVRQQRVKA